MKEIRDQYGRVITENQIIRLYSEFYLVVKDKKTEKLFALRLTKEPPRGVSLWEGECEVVDDIERIFK